MANSTVYIVIDKTARPDKQLRLIDAKSRRVALEHALAGRVAVKTATKAEIIEYLRGGREVETAREDVDSIDMFKE